MVPEEEGVQPVGEPGMALVLALVLIPVQDMNMDRRLEQVKELSVLALVLELNFGVGREGFPGYDSSR